MKRAWKPKKFQSFLDWAETHFVYPQGPKEGLRFRREDAPHYIEIFDAINDKSIRDVTFMASAQVGKTLFACMLICYAVHHLEIDVIYYNSNDDLAVDFGEKKLKEAFLASPTLRPLWPKTSKATGEKDNLNVKRFRNGCTIDLLGAFSKRNFRDKSAPLVILDEVSSYELNVGGNGDPVALAKDRTKAYTHTRKHVLISTPTIEGECRIHASFVTSDQRKFKIPCPDCFHYHELLFENVHYLDPEKPEHACPSCGIMYNERTKRRQIKKGKWVADSSAKKHAGFQLGELASLISSTESVVYDYLDRKDTEEGRQAFSNTNLGLVYKLRQQKRIKEDELMDRCEAYTYRCAPWQIGLVVTTVDTQDKYLYVQQVGFGLKDELWVLRTEIIEGDPDFDETWDRVLEILGEPITSETGTEQYSQICFVDLAGHRTEAATEFVRNYQEYGVYGIYGSKSAETPYVVDGRKENKYGYIAFQVGVHRIKSEIYRRLTENVQAGPKCIHFPKVEKSYFLELLAEKLVDVNGQQRYKKIRERNEALDTLVYAVAAKYQLLRENRQLEALISRQQKVACHGSGNSETAA
jgi:phage terminase large subunit GpA-like protein